MSRLEIILNKITNTLVVGFVVLGLIRCYGPQNKSIECVHAEKGKIYCGKIVDN